MDSFELCVFVSGLSAGGAAAMFVMNSLQFRRSGRISSAESPAAKVSVLIPARNEAARLGATLDSLLTSSGVDLEVLVLDDESTDGTDRLVERYGAADRRVRLLRGRPIPGGWSGKQWACQQLGESARPTAEELIFVDADVQVTADCLVRTVGLRRALGLDLLSGFPRQRVESLGERLLIPQMHVILLCFLPFLLMRRTRMPSASAGCGQYMATTPTAWRQAGGHAAIRESLHDGIRLPRVFRQRGLRTDVFDASDIAVCRMYESFGETWRGLLKNAVEGFAQQPLLIVISLIISASAIAPVLFLPAAIICGCSPMTGLAVAVSIVLSYLPRIVCCFRFDGAWTAVWLQPVAMALFLTVQWTAWIRHWLGLKIQWRSRIYESAAS